MKNIHLITALPRTGKSTIIQKIINEMGENQFCGFFTKEIREKGERVGFKIQELGGTEFIFSHVDMKSSYKISRYFVDIERFEKFIQRFFKNIDGSKILVIDEIGSMQVLSPLFKQEITKLFNKPITVLGTIFFSEHEWLDEIKKSRKIDLINLTMENRDEILPVIVDKLNDTRKHIASFQDELERKNIKSEKYIPLFKDGTLKIESEHGIREIKDDVILGVSCTCDFYEKANTCSHIMAYQKKKNEDIHK